MIKKFKVIPVPTKDNTGIVLITQGVCSGSLVKKEYYGMLQEDMGDTYVHLIGIGEETIEKGDTVFNLNTKEIYKCKEEYGVECEKVILFSTDSSLAYERKFEYKIPTIHRSTYTGLIQQHNHREGMWLDVLMEKPEHPERTDDVHLDAVNFNHWLDIKDKWFIRTFNNIVVVKGEVSEITHPNNVATNYIQDSKIKGDDARMVSRAFKAGMDYVNTQLTPNTEWNDNSKIKPPIGGEYNVVWKLDDGQYPVTSSMDWDAIKKVWTDPRCNDCEVHNDVLYWKELPEPPKFIDEKIWK